MKEQTIDPSLKERFDGKVSDHEGREAICLDPSNYIATFAENRNAPAEMLRHRVCRSSANSARMTS